MHSHDVTAEGLYIEAIRAMARKQGPVSEEEIEALRKEMDEQREEIREALAEDLGGEPEDYDVEEYLSDRAGNLWLMAANRPVSDDELDRFQFRCRTNPLETWDPQFNDLVHSQPESARNADISAK